MNKICFRGLLLGHLLERYLRLLLVDLNIQNWERYSILKKISLLNIFFTGNLIIIMKHSKC